MAEKEAGTRINSTEFGSVTINRKKYNHDVWIFPDGTVEERDKDHEFTAEEMEYLATEHPDTVLVGTGQNGVVKISEGAVRIAEQRGIELVAGTTPDIIHLYNEISQERKVVAAIHVTC